MALYCSLGCRSYWVQDSSPACSTEQSCSWLGHCVEVGSFHSSLLRLPLTSQKKAHWPYHSRACHGGMQSKASFIAITLTPEEMWAAPWHPALQTCPVPCATSSLRISSHKSVVLRRTVASCCRNLHAGKSREMCIPVPPAHPPLPCSPPGVRDASPIPTNLHYKSRSQPSILLFGKLLILCVPGTRDGADSKESAHMHGNALTLVHQILTVATCSIL